MKWDFNMPDTTLPISSIGDNAGAPKPGIANLKLKQLSGRTFSDDAAAKGGEGGGSGEPPLPLSNAEFLANVMRDVPDGATAVICSKTGDPTSGDWSAVAVGEVDTQCPGTRNNYVNCSSFVTADDGSVKARKDTFSAFHFLVLDDVGTKVDALMLDGFRATWRIETSPGNFQVGIRMTEPVRDQTTVETLQSAVVDAGLCDAGAKGVARWVRLPNAVNGKSKYSDDAGRAFKCRLVEFNPDVSYTADELIQRLGIEPKLPGERAASSRKASSPSIGASTVWAPPPAVNPVLSALEQRGLYKHANGTRCHEVTCPWVEEHTDAIDTGAAYFEPSESYPGGGFVCHHSHGDRYHLADLLTFLGVSEDASRGRARIDVVPGEMNAIRDAAERSLLIHGGFFQSGGAIVVVRVDPGTGDVSQELVGEPALTSALASAADWFKYDARTNKSVRCDPSGRHVQQLHRAQHYQHLPVLRGLTRQPYFSETDGNLVSQPGYDPVTGLYSAYDADAFNMPEPTEAAAREALTELQSLLTEYRFADDTDQSATIAAMLTAAVRPSLLTAPAFNITASTPGSGKSYLASTITPFAGPGIPLEQDDVALNRWGFTWGV